MSRQQKNVSGSPPPNLYPPTNMNRKNLQLVPPNSENNRTAGAYKPGPTNRDKKKGELNGANSRAPKLKGVKPKKKPDPRKRNTSKPKQETKQVNRTNQVKRNDQTQRKPTQQQKIDENNLTPYFSKFLENPGNKTKFRLLCFQKNKAYDIFFVEAAYYLKSLLNSNKTKHRSRAKKLESFMKNHLIDRTKLDRKDKLSFKQANSGNLIEKLEESVLYVLTKSLLSIKNNEFKTSKSTNAEIFKQLRKCQNLPFLFLADWSKEDTTYIDLLIFKHQTECKDISMLKSLHVIDIVNNTYWHPRFRAFCVNSYGSPEFIYFFEAVEYYKQSNPSKRASLGRFIGKHFVEEFDIGKEQPPKYPINLPSSLRKKYLRAIKNEKQWKANFFDEAYNAMLTINDALNAFEGQQREYYNLSGKETARFRDMIIYENGKYSFK